jgi:hypothetical protein
MPGARVAISATPSLQFASCRSTVRRWRFPNGPAVPDQGPREKGEEHDAGQKSRRTRGDKAEHGGEDGNEEKDDGKSQQEGSPVL